MPRKRKEIIKISSSCRNINCDLFFFVSVFDTDGSVLFHPVHLEQSFEFLQISMPQASTQWIITLLIQRSYIIHTSFSPPFILRLFHNIRCISCEKGNSPCRLIPYTNHIIVIIIKTIPTKNIKSKTPPKIHRPKHFQKSVFFFNP